MRLSKGIKLHEIAPLFAGFVSYWKSDIVFRKKYKAYILKQVPCILKYMACIFCDKPCVFSTDAEAPFYMSRNRGEKRKKKSRSVL